VEGGTIWSQSNSIQLPRDDTATVQDLPSLGPVLGARLYASANLSESWSLRFLYAPLKLKYSYVPTSAVRFNGKNFEAGRPLDVRYKFNSYRATIIKKWKIDAHQLFRLGFSAKVRDAYVDLSNPVESSRYSNVGFVPLLHLGWDWKFTDLWTLSSELEGLAGGPGRAFDGRLDIGKSLDEKSKVSGGYRFVEGGANTAKVKNFALIHFFFLAYERDLF
jgi:hypothetical protein